MLIVTDVRLWAKSPALRRLHGWTASYIMQLMTTLPISLNDEDRRFIEEIMKTGRYLSESEVVAEALSEFKIREAIRRDKLADIKARIQVGVEQAERGEFAEFTAEDVKSEGRARLGLR